MLSIIWMFFVAWFLNLFGLGDLVIKGIKQFGGPEITMTGYYFIFACAGLLKHILYAIRRDSVKENVEDLEESFEKLTK